MMAPLFEQLTQARTDAPRALLVGLMHHPLESDKSGEPATNTDAMLMNASTMRDAIVLLSGHVHSAGWKISQQQGSTFLLISASTPTKPEESRYPDTSRGFSLI